MCNRIYLKYENVVNNYQSVIKYLCRTSDIFTLTPIIRKPYSQIPPSYKYSNELQPFATKYLFYKSEWLVDFLTPWKHQIMVVYRCCKQSRDELLKYQIYFCLMNAVRPRIFVFIEMINCGLQLFLMKSSVFASVLLTTILSFLRKMEC